MKKEVIITLISNTIMFIIYLTLVLLNKEILAQYIVVVYFIILPALILLLPICYALIILIEKLKK